MEKTENYIDDENSDPDWMYKPILKQSTHTDYDGGKVEVEYMLL